MTDTSAGEETFVLSTFIALKNAEGSYGPVSSTDGCGEYPSEYLYDYLKELIEDGYVLNPAHDPNPTDTELFLIVEVPASHTRTGWKVWCQIAQDTGLAHVLERVFSELDEATLLRLRNQPS